MDVGPLCPAGPVCLFGDFLDNVNPNYTNSYLVFDEGIWKMLYQYPSFLSHDLIKQRDHMMASLEA